MRVTRMNGDVLPILLVDGYVAGVWRPVEGGIEATAFHRLSDDVWEWLLDLQVMGRSAKTIRWYEQKIRWYLQSSGQ